MRRADAIGESPARSRAALWVDVPDGADAEETIAALRDRVARLDKINAALIGRVERSLSCQGDAYNLFQTAVSLQSQVRARTQALSKAMAALESANRALKAARAEAELARNRLANVVEAIPEGVALYDENDRLKLWNSSFERLAEAIPCDLREDSVFADLLTSACAQGLVARDAPAVQAWLRQHAAPPATPEPVVLNLRDGRHIQVRERRTADGGVVGLHADVTEVMRSQEAARAAALREKALELRATLENLNQGVSMFDIDLRLQLWNPRLGEILKLPAHTTYKGAFMRDLIAYLYARGDRFYRQRRCARNAVAICAAADCVMTEIRDWIAAGAQGSLVHEIRCADGRIILVQRRAVPGGGFVSAYSDVTAERRAVEALARSNETLEQRVRERTAELEFANAEARKARVLAEDLNASKTRFLAAASHDLLQPLNAARLFVSALGDAESLDDAHALSRRIDMALSSVEELLGALLEIAKLDAGSPKPDMRDVSLGELIDAIADEFAVIAENRDIALHVRPTRMIVRSDMMLLRRMVQNLVANAIRYSRRGRVLLGVRRRGDAAHIEVWDTGPGVRAEEREAIFREFYRAHDAGRDRDRDRGGKGGDDGGLGLGLAIVQRAARMLGHQVTLRSWPGRGSVFSIVAPLVDERFAAPAGDSAPAPIVTGFPGRRVIAVVENDAVSREAMTLLLKRWSMVVIAGASAGEVASGLAAADATPDLVIADYHLDNDRTGIAAIADLRAGLDERPPALIVTADHSPAIRDTVRAAGYEIVYKPLRPASLRAMISHLLT